jgi:hypothetical protein
MIRLFTRGLIRAAMTGWTARDDIELATVTWRAYPTPRPGRSASASQAEQATNHRACEPACRIWGAKQGANSGRL